MGIAIRLIVCSALALASASTRAQEPVIDATKFYSALSCRLSSISGGQRNTAAVFEDTFDAIKPLRLVRINAGPAGSELEVITPRKNLLIVGHIGPIHDQFYWTPNDDLVVWSATAFLHLPAQDIRAGSSPRFGITWAGGSSLLLLAERDIIPEHIRTTARVVGEKIERTPLEFELSTRDISSLPIPVGPHSTAAWTENDEFVRLRTDYNTWQQYLDVFDRATSAWVPFTRAAMPSKSVLVLVRNNPLDTSLEAAIRWRDQSGVDRIGIVKRGAQGPQVIASDKHLDKILVSPDRSRIYGFVDLFGRFHRVSTESQKPGVAFWLARLEQTQGIEKVYFLSDAKFALIKANSPIAGPEIQLLERRGNAVAVRHTVCAGGSDVARVAEGEHSILFVPKGASGSKLIVYLHDGPFARVDRGGNWLIDLLLSSGNPVLAVNYTGSIGREPTVKDDRSFVDVFGDEIGRAVAFANRELGPRDRRIVLVSEGVGSLVGFSAISSRKVAPAGFAIISGATRVERLYPEFQSQRDTATYNYLVRAARQVRQSLEPDKVRTSHPGLRLLLVHGNKDERATYGDIVEFARRYNAAGPAPSVELVVVDDMDHSPSRRTHYDEVVKAIGDFLSQL